VGIAGGKAERILLRPAFDYAHVMPLDGKLNRVLQRPGRHHEPVAGECRRIVSEGADERRIGFSSPSWTPDGSYVLARREETSKRASRRSEIWMYHRDGGSGVKVISKDKIDTSAGRSPARMVDSST